MSIAWPFSAGRSMPERTPASTHGVHMRAVGHNRWEAPPGRRAAAHRLTLPACAVPEPLGRSAPGLPMACPMVCGPSMIPPSPGPRWGTPPGRRLAALRPVLPVCTVPAPAGRYTPERGMAYGSIEPALLNGKRGRTLRATPQDREQTKGGPDQNVF